MADEISKVDKNMAVGSVPSDLRWYDIRQFTMEGKGWEDTDRHYDRLPARARETVPQKVWDISHRSAGLCARFKTDATSIFARWTISMKPGMLHMADTGNGGLDLYARNEEGLWRFVGVGQPRGFPESCVPLVERLRPGKREYILYLPLYNEVESVEIGIDPAGSVTPAELRPHRPIVFYGSSITQGGCATRPGMAYAAIVGRRLDCPIINLGFSGNAKMEPQLAELIAELDASIYVIDALPNMVEPQVTERAEPFVKILRDARGEAPIVLIEHIRYQNAEFVPPLMEKYTTCNVALRAAYERLVSAGVGNLHYIGADNLLGDDGEATVDGTHPTDLGFMRIAEEIIPLLSRLMEKS